MANTKINTRSPFFIGNKDTNQESAVLEIYIYTDAPHTVITGTPDYTLETLAIDERVTFEISELIKDFIPGHNNGDYEPDTNDDNYATVYVDYILTPTISGIPSATIDTFASRAFLGYGYFQENTNPQLAQAALQSNSVILKPGSAPLRMAMDRHLAAVITFMKDGIITKTEAISAVAPDDEGYMSIIYVSDLSIYSADDYTDFVEGQGGTVEGSQCLENFLDNYEWLPTDTVIIEDDKEEITIFEVKSIDTCKYDPIKVTFRNKFGALQDLWFFGNNQKSITTKKQQYKSNTIESNLIYQVSNPQQKLFNKMGNESITLNSGFYPESNNDIFKELLLSEQVWMEYEDVLVGVIVKNSSLSYKTHLTESLINYSINFDFAFDTINTIR